MGNKLTPEEEDEYHKYAWVIAKLVEAPDPFICTIVGPRGKVCRKPSTRFFRFQGVIGGQCDKHWIWHGNDSLVQEISREEAMVYKIMKD